MIPGRPPQTVRDASQADTLVNDMRALMQAADPVAVPRDDDADDVERAVSSRVTTLLMVLLLSLLFMTSAVPDIGPSLAGVVQAHL